MLHHAMLNTGRVPAAFCKQRPSQSIDGHRGNHVMIPKCFQRHHLIARACLRASTQMLSVSSDPTRRRLQCAALPVPGLPSPQQGEPVTTSSLELLSGGSSSSDNNSDAESSVGGFSDGEAEPGAVQIDLELPRRSLLVTFTCNRCDGRTERLVNPIAWNKGMVIAQCGTCQAWHKLADAANLVEEIRYTNSDDE